MVGSWRESSRGNRLGNTSRLDRQQISGVQLICNFTKRIFQAKVGSIYAFIFGMNLWIEISSDTMDYEFGTRKQHVTAILQLASGALPF